MGCCGHFVKPNWCRGLCSEQDGLLPSRAFRMCHLLPHIPKLLVVHNSKASASQKCVSLIKNHRGSEFIV